jgi:prefoldin subunit 5
MEAQIVKHNEGIKVKIPDIEKAIEAVEYMQKKRSETKDTEKANLNIDFMVSNNLWAKADVPIGDTVCLWLGADIMCEYSFDEARTLLAKNLTNAQITLGNNETDLDYLKDQITTCEVSKEVLPFFFLFFVVFFCVFFLIFIIFF